MCACRFVLWFVGSLLHKQWLGIKDTNMAAVYTPTMGCLLCVCLYFHQRGGVSDQFQVPTVCMLHLYRFHHVRRFGVAGDPISSILWYLYRKSHHICLQFGLPMGTVWFWMKHLDVQCTLTHFPPLSPLLSFLHSPLPPSLLVPSPAADSLPGHH